jgi:hypothetical protein
MSDFEGVSAYAEYNSFNVEDAAANYRMVCSGYSGNAGWSAVSNQTIESKLQFQETPYHIPMALSSQHSMMIMIHGEIHVLLVFMGLFGIYIVTVPTQTEHT